MNSQSNDQLNKYHLLSHEKFLGLVEPEDNERLELKLILLGLAGALLRTIQPRPYEAQVKHLYGYLNFTLNEFPALQTCRPASSHYFIKEMASDPLELMLVKHFEEFSAYHLSNITGDTENGAIAPCSLVHLDSVTLFRYYRSLIWEFVLQCPELMTLSPAEYALDSLFQLKLLRRGKSDAP